MRPGEGGQSKATGQPGEAFFNNPGRAYGAQFSTDSGEMSVTTLGRGAQATHSYLCSRVIAGAVLRARGSRRMGKTRSARRVRLPVTPPAGMASRLLIASRPSSTVCCRGAIRNAKTDAVRCGS